jgi:hypothetical protein
MNLPYAIPNLEHMMSVISTLHYQISKAHVAYRSLSQILVFQIGEIPIGLPVGALAHIGRFMAPV